MILLWMERKQKAIIRAQRQGESQEAEAVGAQTNICGAE